MLMPLHAPPVLTRVTPLTSAPSMVTDLYRPKISKPWFSFVVAALFSLALSTVTLRQSTVPPSPPEWRR